MDDADRAIVDALQDGVDVCERPFAAAATALGIEEAMLVERLGRLRETGILTRFGPMYDAERLGGAVTLAAMRVSPERFEAVAGVVNAFDEVAHNYEREHALNMWFVLATETREEIPEIVAAIAAQTGCAVHDMPKLEEYYIGLRFRAGEGEGGGCAAASGVTSAAPVRSPAGDGLDATDRAIVAATQAGLPLVARPYHAVAAGLDVEPAELMRRLRRLLDTGAVRRIAAVPNHYALGYRANGMSVWDVDDAHVSEAGRAVGALAFVSHCYRRPRHPPIWPYNLFAMVHGRSRDAVEARVAEIAAVLGPRARSRDILYSRRILKKTGLRLHASVRRGGQGDARGRGGRSTESGPEA